MPTQLEYNISKQRLKNLRVRVNLLNYNFQTVGELSGDIIELPTFSNDSNSDIRRTCSVALTPRDASFDIKRGNKIWLDKYIQVFIEQFDMMTQQYVSTNMGIYLINNPQRVYSATENKLTFQGVDLMAKLTGLRNGNLKGVPHVIPQGSNVRTAMIAILDLCGFKNYTIEECEIDVPNDITVNVGGTAYDILKQLRDILPNYQIYFDVDGVFCYNKIPSGKNEQIMVDDDIWHNILINYNKSTDFEKLKNSIEVYGRTHNVTNYGEATNEGTYYNINLPQARSFMLLETGFTTPYTLYDGEPKLQVTLNSSNVEILNRIAQDSLNKSNSLLQELNPNGNVDVLNRPLISGQQMLQKGYTDCEYDSINTVYSSVWDVWQGNDEDGYNMRVHATPIMSNGNVLTAEELVSYLYEVLEGSDNIIAKDANEKRLIINAVRNDTKLPDNFYDEYGEKLQNQQDYYYNEYAPTFKNYNKTKEYVDNIHPIPIRYEDGRIPTLQPRIYYVVKYIEEEDYFMFLGQLTPYGKAEETNPDSPFYVDGDVGVINIVLNFDNIYTTELAQERAEWELYQRCRLLDNVTVNCVPTYWLDTNWLVEITLPNKYGTEEKELYIIKSINTKETQSIELVKYYPYYETQEYITYSQLSNYSYNRLSHFTYGEISKGLVVE